MLFSPEHQYFTVFGFSIYFYGIILAFSIFVGLLLAEKIAESYYNINFIFDNALFLIFSGLIGARLYYCILNTPLYLETPLRILNIREGGLSIHGALIGGIITLFLLAKKYHYKLLELCDIFAIILPISQSIGRWGNFVNSEAFGLPTTNNLIKLYIEPHFRPLGYEKYDYFHPTFLYESILDLFLFIILYKCLLKKFHKHPGFLSGVYLIGYSTIRLLIEPLRLDCTTFVFNMPVPMIISFVMGICGCFFIKKSLSSK